MNTTDMTTSKVLELDNQGSRSRTFDDLPDKLVQKIFGSVPVQDRKSMSLVSKRWNESVTTLWYHQEGLVIKWRKEVGWFEYCCCVKSTNTKDHGHLNWPANQCNVKGHRLSEMDIVELTGNVSLLLMKSPNLKALYICNELSPKQQTLLAKAVNKYCQRLEHIGYSRPDYDVSLTTGKNLWNNFQPNFEHFKCLEVDGDIAFPPKHGVTVVIEKITIDRFFPTLTNINLDVIVGGNGHVESFRDGELFEPMNVQYLSSSVIQAKAAIISTYLNNDAYIEYLKSLTSLEKLTIEGPDIDQNIEVLEKLLVMNKIKTIVLKVNSGDSSGVVTVLETIETFAKHLHRFEFVSIGILDGTHHWSILAEIVQIRKLRITGSMAQEQLKIVLGGLKKLNSISIRVENLSGNRLVTISQAQVLMNILSEHAVRHSKRIIDIDADPFMESNPRSYYGIHMMASIDMTTIAKNIRFYRQKVGLVFYQ